MSVLFYRYKVGQIKIPLKKPSSRDGRPAMVCRGGGLLAGKGQGSTHGSLPGQSKQQFPSPQHKGSQQLSYRC